MGQARRLINFFQGKGIKFSALMVQPCDQAAFHYSKPSNEVTVNFVGTWNVKKIDDLRKDFAIVIPGSNEFIFKPENLKAEEVNL